MLQKGAARFIYHHSPDFFSSVLSNIALERKAEAFDVETLST